MLVPDGDVAGAQALEDEVGATAVEYALLTAFVAGVIVTILITLGTQIRDLFHSLIGTF